MVSKLSDFNNSLCRWQSGDQKVIDLFSRQAIPMVWDFIEENPFAENLMAPGAEEIAKLLQRCHDEGAAVLILLDEVLDYIVRAKAIQVRDGTLAQQTTAFIDSLARCVAGDPRTVMVYSLQKSIQEALGDAGLLQMLEKLVARQEAQRIPVDDADIGEVVRKRLFKSPGDPAVRQRVAAAYARQHRDYLLGTAATDAARRQAEEDARRLEAQVEAAYPFHPALLRLMYERWSTLPSYQRTRGVLSFLATVTHYIYKKGHDAPLIGPGDIPFEIHDVRTEFFKQVGQQGPYTPVISSDVAGDEARCRLTDQQIGKESPLLSQARVGTRLSRALLLYSLGVRRDDARGVGEVELIAATLQPGVDAPVLKTALDDLRERLLYIYSGGGRYRLETVANLTRVVEETERQLPAEDVMARLVDVLKKVLGDRSEVVAWPESPAQVPDERRGFLVVYAPLEWAELTPEQQRARAREWVQFKGAGDKRDRRSFRNSVAFALPGKAQAERARERARNVLALEQIRKDLRARKSDRKRLTPEDEELLADADNRHGPAQKELESTLRALYGMVLLPGRLDADGQIGMKEVELQGLAAHGGALHKGVMETLKDKVFATLKDDRFVEQSGVGERRFRPAKEVVNGYFELLDRPKVHGEAVLRKALADAAGRGKIGYVAQATEGDGGLQVERPETVLLGTTHQADEFDLGDGAYLLSPDYARALREGPKAPPEDVGGEVGGEGPKGGEAAEEQGGDEAAQEGRGPAGDQVGEDKPKYPEQGDRLFVDAPPRQGRGGAKPPVEATRKDKAPTEGTPAAGEVFTLEATSKGVKQWFKLGKALGDIAAMGPEEMEMEVTVRLVAKKKAGFDAGKLQNQVEETLTENDVEHTAKRSPVK